MFELFTRARWDQAEDILMAGDPPMLYKLLGLNALFLVFYVIRRAKGVPPMRQHVLFQLQALVLLANFLVIFENTVKQYIDRFI